MKFIIKTAEDFLRLLNKSSVKDIKKPEHIERDDYTTDDYEPDNYNADNYAPDDYYDSYDYAPDDYNAYYDDMDIFDVTDFTSSRIPKKNNNNTLSKKNFNNDRWYKKLNRYSIGYRYMPIQIEIASKELYEKTCNYLDNELKNNKSSLIKLINKLNSSPYDQAYILNILYHISRDIVDQHYIGVNKVNRDDYPYNRLQSYIGNELMINIYAMADKLGKELPPADEHIREYYNITENGLAILWWDRDGEIREEAIFEHIPRKIIHSIPERYTKVWDVQGVRKLIITLYLEIWSVLTNGLQSDIKWKNKVKNVLSDIVVDEEYTHSDYDYADILTSLIKLSENTVREILPCTSLIKIYEESENIKHYLPKVVADNIFTLCGQYQENISKDELHKIIDEMIKDNPNEWKLKAEQILNQSDNIQLDLLISYANDVNFTKIIKNVINKTNDENLVIFCLYGLSMKEKLTVKNTKLLNTLIHHSNMPQFNKLQDEPHDLTVSLYKELIRLKNPIRKKIELDLDKIKESKDILNNTVDKISEYIGEDITNDIVKVDDLVQEKQVSQVYNEKNNGISNEKSNGISNEKNNEINNKANNKIDDNIQGINLKHIDFIESLLDNERLKISQVKELATKSGALLHSFINDINKELYEYLQDQAIIMDENYVMIDEFYVDMIKELVAND